MNINPFMKYQKSNLLQSKLYRKIALHLEKVTAVTFENGIPTIKIPNDFGSHQGTHHQM